MEATGARRGSAFLRWWRRCRCRPWMAGAGSAPGQGCGTTPAGCARRGEEEEEEEEREGLGPQGIAGGRWGGFAVPPPRAPRGSGRPPDLLLLPGLCSDVS